MFITIQHSARRIVDSVVNVNQPYVYQIYISHRWLIIRSSIFRLYNTEICLYEPWRSNGVFKFAVIITDLVSSFHFIWNQLYLCYGSTAVINIVTLLVRGSILDIDRSWCLKSVRELKGFINKKYHAHAFRTNAGQLAEDENTTLL